MLLLTVRENSGNARRDTRRDKTDDTEAWFHNGLDIPAGYGETARFIRDEKVLDPDAVENFDTLRELIRMPTIGYVHIRIGRDASGNTYDDGRFLFDNANGKPSMFAFAAARNSLRANPSARLTQ